MVRYVVLLNFTEKGLATVKDSANRAAAFRAAAMKAGAAVEALYWTLGTYDGIVVLSAPDDATVAAVVLQLARGGNVHTCMLRAFEEAEFQQIAGKVT